MLFYDDLTKNYYIAKNAYDKTLPEGTTIKFELISKTMKYFLILIQRKKLLYLITMKMF